MSKKLETYWLIFVAAIVIILPRHTYAQEKASQSSAAPLPRVKNVADDKRVRLLRGYLNQYNSPLADSAQTFVEEADKNQLDWRLLAAISGVESTFGSQIPYNSYNAWGWGIYGDNMIRFATFDQGIETITKSLKKDYVNKLGTDDVYAIGRIYAASPTWAVRVERFMEKISDYEVRNPQSALSLSL